jgi:hypothetical protein
LKHVIAPYATFRSTFATQTYTATYVYNHCNICNVPIYFSNIQIKQLKHTFETSETFETYVCNIGEGKVKAGQFQSSGWIWQQDQQRHHQQRRMGTTASTGLGSGRRATRATGGSGRRAVGVRSKQRVGHVERGASAAGGVRDGREREASEQSAIGERSNRSKCGVRHTASRWADAHGQALSILIFGQ